MAPKKNRIKVEQDLQGKSCPDRATPPSTPEVGATRRQRQKPKKLRRVWWQVNKLQKSAELYTPFADFVRLITESLPSQVKCWSPEALLSLQDAADFYLNETFCVEIELAILPIRASSKVGATRRQRMKPKKLRRVWWQVNKLQKSAELYTPFADFVRLVKEITEPLPSQVKRWTPEALLALQDAAEFYLNETFCVDLEFGILLIRASSEGIQAQPTK